MANITRTDWPKGWFPSSDAVNGDPDGLLRMDNLQRDEFGCLTLVRGIQQTSVASAFPDFVDQIYSKLLVNSEALWVSIGENGGMVVRSASGNFGADAQTMGGNDRASFGDALGYVFILAGNSRFKDDGSSTPKNLGLITPGVPGIAKHNNNGGPLNGTYTYICVNTVNNGIYVAKSPPGRPSFQETFINGTATISTAGTEPGVNFVEIYRRSVFVDGETPSLSQYYLIGTVTQGGVFEDNISDQQALLIGQPANLYLKSLQPLGDGNGILEPIYGIEGLFYERMLYMSLSYIYISDRLNPDAIDSRYTIKAFGDPTEKNLWLKKLTNNVLILGTSKNLYEITGTLGELPDGTIDVQINPIGENHPPLTKDCCSTAGTIFYMGSDGVRATSGSNSQLISPQLRSLFQGINCHGIAPVVISQYARYAMAVGKTRLYITLPLQDGTRWLLIYDLISKTWRLQRTDPISLNVTQSDRVLVGYNITGHGFTIGELFDLDKGTGFSDTSGTEIVGQSIYFLTVFDHNNQPRNRKDLFTLKIICDTGDDYISIYMGKDGGTLKFLKDVKSNGLSTLYIPLNDADLTLGFRYAIKIVDKNYLSRFKLYELTVEYEPRPEQLNYLRIQPNNLGTISRKRITNYAFIIDTLGHNVTFTPFLDNSNAGLLPLNSVVNTNAKTTYIHQFTQEQIGTDINGTLASVNTDHPFEFYQVNLEEIVSEKMPVPVKFLVIPANNYGSPNRKRHTSYKFQINTNGHDVTFTPLLDNFPYSSRVFNTNRKTTVEYFFDLAAGDVIGIDIGGTLSGDNFFEFYGTVVPQDIETLPPRLEYFRIPNSNLGSISRKRFVNYAFVIDTYGHNVTFTPLIDNSNNNILPATTTVNFNGKQTHIHYFTQEQIGTDIGGFLAGDSPFECYGIDTSKIVTEDLPVPAKYLVIPNNNYGTPNRKRHTSYKFQIDTRNKNVLFTPHLDNVLYDTAIFNTSTKTTVDYFFDTNKSDIIGIDIGGTLQSLQDTPFEFYGVVVPQEVEALPSRLEYFRIPNTNFGVAARKRVRTIPLVLDTRGNNVTYTPIVDGVTSGPSAIFTTDGKLTVYYYFSTDSFGTDYGGQLVCPSGNFEFYGFGKASGSDKFEIVEVLPVPKKYDQLGPTRFDKIGKVFSFRTRMIMNGTTTTVPFSILGENDISNPNYFSALYSSSFSVKPGIDDIYEIQLPKSINTSVFRLVLGPTSDSFHRYDLQIRVATSGMETDAKWIPVR